MSRYERFDRDKITLKDIDERGHDLLAVDCLPLEPLDSEYNHPEFEQLVERIIDARKADRPVILMTGAHPIKLGLSRFLIDLVHRGLVTHIATNGAGMIHDFELATIGGTSESVAKWIRVGQFGLWRETGRLNEIAVEAAKRDEGLGEAVGRTVCEDDTQNLVPHAELSLAAAAWR
ncbi:MAG: hypothetical protein JXM70_27370, partial [Pirellulales bacterium]|nr:hypothetical protein [Pirellulales bacterium]